MFKKVSLLTVLFLSPISLYSFASTSTPVQSENFEPAHESITQLREQMLREASYSVGFKQGMAHKSKRIIHALEQREHNLDDIFQFSTLISIEGVLPPVIVHAQNSLSVSSDQLRTASEIYSIVKPERFISTPPTWRDYLFVGLNTNSDGDIFPEAVKPTTKPERELWTRILREGFKDGEQQAFAIIEENFNRIVREYIGMLRYKSLLQKRMVVPFETEKLIDKVNIEPKKLIIDDKLQRLTKEAVFDSNFKNWLKE